jgi:HlyD family secretion protein
VFELAEVALERARDNRELTRSGRVSGSVTEVERIIRATASGTVLSRTVNPGDPVVPLTSYQPGTELATIADMSDLIFKGTVDEIDVGKIIVGMPCRIKVGALPNDMVTGWLSRIAPQAEKSEGATLFDVEIELDPDQGIVLRAGYSANADIVIREKDGILLMPERLVLFEGEGDEAATFVEIPGDSPDAEPHKVPVELGLSDGLNVEVVEGLEQGDRVVQRPPREIS